MMSGLVATTWESRASERARALALGLVAVDRQQRLAAFGLDLDAGDLHRQPPAGGGAQRKLLRRRGFAGRHRGQARQTPRRQLARTVLGVVEAEQRLADQIFLLPGAEQRQRGAKEEL